MNTYKVCFKGETPVIVQARDEIDAATVAAKDRGFQLTEFCYAVKLEVLKDIKTDIWTQVA